MIYNDYVISNFVLIILHRAIGAQLGVQVKQYQQRPWKHKLLATLVQNHIGCQVHWPGSPFLELFHFQNHSIAKHLLSRNSHNAP